MPENGSVSSSSGSSSSASSSNSSSSSSESSNDSSASQSTEESLSSSASTGDTLSGGQQASNSGGSDSDRTAQNDLGDVGDSAKSDFDSRVNASTTNNAETGLDSLMDDAMDVASDAFDSAKELASDAIDVAKEAANDALETASELNDEYAITTRAVGVAKVAGGFAEAAIGAVGVAAPEPLTSIGGGLMVAHGADLAAAGVKEALTGQSHETLTDVAVTETAKALGADDATADAIGDSVDAGLSLGAAGVGVARSLSTQGVAATGAISARGGQQALDVPQGLTKSQFQEVSDIVRKNASAKGLGDDIVVQGSRAEGTATRASDIDIGIKMSPEKFDDFLNTQSRIANPNPGSAAARTREHAIESGKIQAGEARLSGVRKEVEKVLDMDVDISVVRNGGKIEDGAQIPLLK